MDAGGDRFGDHVEVSQLHSAGRQFGRRILLGGADQQLSAGRHGYENDSPGQEHQQHGGLEGHLGRTRAEYVSRSSEDPQGREGRAELHAMRFAADRR